MAADGREARRRVERSKLRGEPYDAPIDVTALFRDMHALRESRRAVA